MSLVMSAFGCATRSMFQPGILWHVFWPMLVSLLFWTLMAWFSWTPLSIAVEQLFREREWLQWIVAKWGAAPSAAMVLAGVVLGLILVPLVYGTALFIVAVFAMPLIIEKISDRDYQDLEKRRGGTWLGSAWNAFLALVVFVSLWLVTLPLWLFPGGMFFVPLILSAYVNQRTYRYDVLALHADSGELTALIREERGTFWLAGFYAGALSYIPLVNLVIPAYAGLVFAHLGLESLRRYRDRVELCDIA